LVCWEDWGDEITTGSNLNSDLICLGLNREVAVLALGDKIGYFDDFDN